MSNQIRLLFGVLLSSAACGTLGCQSKQHLPLDPGAESVNLAVMLDEIPAGALLLDAERIPDMPRYTSEGRQNLARNRALLKGFDLVLYQDVYPGSGIIEYYGLDVARRRFGRGKGHVPVVASDRATHGLRLLGEFESVWRSESGLDYRDAREADFQRARNAGAEVIWHRARFVPFVGEVMTTRAYAVE